MPRRVVGQDSFCYGFPRVVWKAQEDAIVVPYGAVADGPLGLEPCVPVSGEDGIGDMLNEKVGQARFNDLADTVRGHVDRGGQWVSTLTRHGAHLMNTTEHINTVSAPRGWEPCARP